MTTDHVRGAGAGRYEGQKGGALPSEGADWILALPGLLQTR